MPLTKRVMFAPASMTDRFKAEYSTAMAMRPSQIRAMVVDGALMMPCAAGLRAHYHELRMPVVIMAGAGDLVVSSRHAERLHEAIRGSALQIVPGIGHMVHHVATSQAARAIADLSSRSQERIPAGQPTDLAPPDTGRRSPSLTTPP